MQGHRLGTILRTVRIKRRWRQVDVSERAGLSPSAIARHERGQIEGARLRDLVSHAEALELHLDVYIRGESGSQLRDDEHAAVAEHLKRQLEAFGWQVVAESSFSEWGERGRVDLLAWHAPTRTLLIIEIKTIVIDVQDLLGGVDVKERLARTIAAKHDWHPANVSVMLAVTDTDANRGHIERLRSLFASFSLRGTAVTSWLRAPLGAPRMLTYVAASAAGRSDWHNGRQRVRKPSPASASR
jgi:transcriptional regulator with XRE-family HTH domain